MARFGLAVFARCSLLASAARSVSRSSDVVFRELEAGPAPHVSVYRRANFSAAAAGSDPASRPTAPSIVGFWEDAAKRGYIVERFQNFTKFYDLARGRWATLTDAVSAYFEGLVDGRAMRFSVRRTPSSLIRRGVLIVEVRERKRGRTSWVSVPSSNYLRVSAVAAPELARAFSTGEAAVAAELLGTWMPFAPNAEGDANLARAPRGIAPYIFSAASGGQIVLRRGRSPPALLRPAGVVFNGDLGDHRSRVHTRFILARDGASLRGERGKDGERTPKWRTAFELFRAPDAPLRGASVRDAAGLPQNYFARSGSAGSKDTATLRGDSAAAPVMTVAVAAALAAVALSTRQ